MAQMKIKTQESILIEKKHVEKGKIVTVEAELGRLLIGCGRAVEAGDEETDKEKGKGGDGK